MEAAGTGGFFPSALFSRPRGWLLHKLSNDKALHPVGKTAQDPKKGIPVDVVDGAGMPGFQNG